MVTTSKMAKNCPTDMRSNPLRYDAIFTLCSSVQPDNQNNVMATILRKDLKKRNAKNNTGQQGHPVLIRIAMVPDLLGGDDAFVAGIRFAATTCVSRAANA